MQINKRKWLGLSIISVVGLVNIIAFQNFGTISDVVINEKLPIISDPANCKPDSSERIVLSIDDPQFEEVRNKFKENNDTLKSIKLKNMHQISDNLLVLSGYYVGNYSQILAIIYYDNKQFTPLIGTTLNNVLNGPSIWQSKAARGINVSDISLHATDARGPSFSIITHSTNPGSIFSTFETRKNYLPACKGCINPNEETYIVDFAINANGEFFILYDSFSEIKSAGLLKSTDLGNTWHKVSNLDEFSPQRIIDKIGFDVNGSPLVAGRESSRIYALLDIAKKSISRGFAPTVTSTYGDIKAHPSGQIFFANNQSERGVQPPIQPGTEFSIAPLMARGKAPELLPVQGPNIQVDQNAVFAFIPRSIVFMNRSSVAVIGNLQYFNNSNLPSSSALLGTNFGRNNVFRHNFPSDIRVNKMQVALAGNSLVSIADKSLGNGVHEQMILKTDCNPSKPYAISK